MQCEQMLMYLSPSDIIDPPLVRTLWAMTLMYNSKDHNKSGYSDLIQTIATVVIAIAAVITALIGQPKPSTVWIFSLIAVVAFVVAVYRPATHFWKEKRRQSVRQDSARKYYPLLMEFARRFNKFTSAGITDNLQYILMEISRNGSMGAGTIRLYPPDYLREIFPLFLMRYETRHTCNADAFIMSVRELYTLVNSYNRYYVCDPLRILRDGNWPPQLSEASRKDAERKIEDFRERWVRFSDDFSGFLEKLSHEWNDPGIPSFFERPEKL